MNPLFFAALLLLSSCSLDRSRETTLVQGHRDMDDKLFRLETLRLQRDMLETERLKLWTTPVPAPTYLGYPRARRR